MIVNIREYLEDPLAVHDDCRGSSLDTKNTGDNLHSDTEQFHFEYIVDTTSLQSSKPIVFKRKGPTHNTTQPLEEGQARRFASTFPLSRVWKQLSKIFVELFLPLGYPHSVHSSYLPYQLYDGLQGLCSYWRGVVATRAVLEASGVGDAQATAASAAMQWALRDGTGMVAGLAFSFCASRYFDTHVKEFRLFADVINDVALTMDMLAPYATTSQWTLYILSLSTIGKTLCGMSAGATKGRITQHFARHGNMADLSAKESTQETLVSLLGMIGGVLVARMLQHLQYFITWILFGFLTLVHVWANYKAVKLLKLETLNPERTKVVLSGILEVLSRQGTDKELDAAIQSLPDPQSVDESLSSSTFDLLFPFIHVSSPLQPKYLQYASEFSKEKYLIGSAGGGSRHHHIYLAIGATQQDELQAFAHALLLDTMIAKGVIFDSKLVRLTFSQIRRVFPTKDDNNSSSSSRSIWKRLDDKGWDLESRLYLGFDSRRVQWTLLKED